MERGYWSNVLNQQVQRRRVLATAGGTAAAAALLAACGGGGSSQGSGGGTGGASGLVSQPADTTQQAKRGGVLKDRMFGDPPSLDMYSAINPLNPPARLAYNTLVRMGPGHLQPSDNAIIPDVAESWEIAPDGLQITMKLRQNVKWHNKPPVNGRTLDVDDVVFAWNRFAAKGTNAGGIANSRNPQAPVLSLTAPDTRTIAIKLKEPLVYALDLFASNPGSHSGSVIMIPKETDSTFNIANDMIGAGPFFVSNYTPSVGFTMKRHPEYWDKDWALVDQIDLPIVSEYAAVLAQFKAGNIYNFGNGSPDIRGEDLVPTKRDEPRISIFTTNLASSTSTVTFGLLPSGKSPFLDERVRQAVSMAWDRDLWIDTFYNATKFGSQGLPVKTRWNSALGAIWDGWWLDPKSKDFGPNARFYQRDIAEAKKLLAAAGYPNGIDGIASNHITTAELGDLPKNADALDGMVSEIGIKSQTRPIDYAKDYVPNYRDGHGQYEGWAYVTTAGGTGVGPVGLMSNQYWSKGGSAFHGFSTSGQNDQSGDPQVDAMLQKARVEQDTEKRRSLVFDIQRYLGGKIYSLLLPGGATGFTVAWPALANYRVFSGYQVWFAYRLWVDATKPPIKNA